MSRGTWRVNAAALSADSGELICDLTTASSGRRYGHLFENKEADRSAMEKIEAAITAA